MSNDYNRTIEQVHTSLQKSFLEKLKGMQWYTIVARQNSPLFESLIRVGATSENPDFGFKNPMRSFAAVLHQTLAVQDEFDALSKLFQQKTKDNPVFLNELFAHLERDVKVLQDIAQSIGGQSWKLVPQEELLVHFNSLVNASLKVLTYIWPPLAIEDWLLEQITNEVSKHYDPTKQFDELSHVISLLTAPLLLTPNQKKEQAMVALATQKTAVEDAKKLYLEYAWLSDSFLHFDYQRWEAFVEEYKNILGESSLVEPTNKERDAWTKKLPEHINQYANQASMLSYWRLLRTESVVQAFYHAQPLLHAIAERLKMHEITSAYFWEIQWALKNLPVDRERIKHRKKGFGLLIIASVPYDLDHVTAARIKAQLTEQHSLKDEFKGNIACAGKGKGKVCIIKSPEEVRKMQSGNVLVTSMTMPAYVPAMKKAAAIITDEGGISCHAAILSRELKIPCIIGTKHATTQLKDGDEVLVDADTGVVSVLHRS